MKKFINFFDHSFNSLFFVFSSVICYFACQAMLRLEFLRGNYPKTPKSHPMIVMVILTILKTTIPPRIINVNARNCKAL